MGVVETVAIIGLVVGVSESKKAKDEAKKSRRAEEAALAKDKEIQGVRARRERVNARRRSRAARAEAVAASVSQTGSTEAAQGAAGSAVSQFRGNVSFLDQLQELTNQGLDFRQEASGAAGRSQSAQALASTGFNVFDAFGGVGAFSSKGKKKGGAGTDAAGTPNTV